MATGKSQHITELAGPSGFIEYLGEMLVVDYGRVYHEGMPVGYLFEDGYLKNTSGVLGQVDQPRPLDEIDHCIFRGIDCSGAKLELPGEEGGPTGNLAYNGLPYQVFNGRVSTFEHKLIGQLTDIGQLYIRDPSAPDGKRKLDDNTQLNSYFEGKSSSGQAIKLEFVRPFARKDKGYSESEIIRYFVGFDGLSVVQKKYVLDTMAFWSSCGLLQIVRKSEGDASLGNVKHGAAGVTGVRTGNVTLDREEFEREIELFRQFGALAVIAKGFRDFAEVRINLVVAHEFGHQLEFVLTQAVQEQIMSLYEQRKRACDKLHPLPPKYQGYAELLIPKEVANRHFISGYARTSMHEYWAECVAAFSIRESRLILKELDPGIYQILTKLVIQPVTVLRRVFHDTILGLQASLKMGNELKDDILS